MWITIYIHHHLVDEAGMIIFTRQSYFLVTQRNINGCIYTCIPCLFLTEVISYSDLSGTGQQIIIFRKDIGSTESLTDRAAKM
ncbi:hypothetical protein SDC9_185654 [bioreactor metagenome]|uniref:Uncharacterized protein n=1 Tax=bioreactor metagenome TaxID=1076179 RepID=A0A645HHB3_9ZZZZ